MIRLMSFTARRELLTSVRQSYRDAGWTEKGKILNGFIAATDYERKYAIQLLSAEALSYWVAEISQLICCHKSPTRLCGRRPLATFELC